MACTIKLKEREQYITFDTESEAREYIINHRLNIERDIHNSENEYLVSKTPTENIVNIIREMNARSWQKTKDVLEKQKVNHWNSEEYAANSDAISLSKLLSSLLTEDGHRLFPEFITDNYLNVLVQDKLCQLFIAHTNSNENPTALRQRVFEDSGATNAKDAKRIPATEWIKKLQAIDDSFVLDDDTLNNIEQEVTAENEHNFMLMIRGEIIHKIFEIILHNPSPRVIKQKIYNEISELKNTLIRNYENDSEVDNPIPLIENVFESLQLDRGVQAFDNILLGQYYTKLKQAKEQIESMFKGKNVQWLSEQRITANLNEGISIQGKNYVRAKLDAILVVDGVAHIIDLKASTKSFNAWPSEKLLKTKYQLATYARILNSIGIPMANSSTYVCAVTFDDETGNMTSDASIQPLSVIHEPNISKNLDSVISSVKVDVKVDPTIQSRVQNFIAELFGDLPAKQAVNVTKENLIETLKSRVVKDGNQYKVSYHILNTSGTESEYKTIKVNAADLDTELDRIADLIITRIQNKSANLYETLCDDISEYFRGTKSIVDFDYIPKKRSEQFVNQLSAILYKYKGSNAEIVFRDLGCQFNMIFIKTDVGIDVINCMTIDPKTPYDITDKNASLFSAVNDNSSDSSKTLGNVEIMKALFVLNEILHQSNIKIGNITCLQLGSNNGYYMPSNSMIVNYEIARTHLNKLNNGFTNHITSTSFLDPLVNVLYGYTRILDASNNTPSVGYGIKYSSIQSLSQNKVTELNIGLDQRDISTIKTSVSDFTVQDKIVALKLLREQLVASHKQYFANLNSMPVTEVTFLYNMINQAIAFYENKELLVENDVSKFGLSRGVMLASMDLIPEHNVRIVNETVQRGNSQIRDIFQKARLETTSHVDRLKKALGFTKTQQIAIGNTTSIYLNLFERDDNGNLTNNDLKFKNPWTSTKLSDTERNFIKYVLYALNKAKHSSWTSWESVRPEDLTDSDYLCPLVRTKGLDHLRDPKGGWNFPLFHGAWWKNQMTKAVDYATDLKETLEGQRSERTSVADTLESMYNEFHTRTNPNVRQELIDRNGGIENFSMDVETILHTFVLAEASEKIYNMDVIPTVKSILYMSMFQANITGIELPDYQEFVKKYMKSAVYGDSVIDEKIRKDYFKYIGPIRSVAAAVSLSYNIMNVPKELLMGVFSNISHAMFDSYGEETFILNEYLSAMGIMLKDVPNFIQNVTKIELLNELYGISNMSINEIPEQATSNKTGIFALFGRFSTWSLTAPDYLNRMSIFIAQMMHDGCWDAYELKQDSDGVMRLEYDMSKDKRFALYAKYKGDLSQVPQNLKSEFQKQAALYEIMREELNKELAPVDRITTSKYTPLPKAYTTLQRNSMKSFSDMTFGYYDRDTKAWFFKTAVGVIFKQFMAYLSAKKMRYFQVRSNSTARGEFKQLEDPMGNKIWTILVDDGSPDGTLLTVTDQELIDKYPQYKDVAKPKLAWTGAYMEGIVQSYLHLFKEIGVGSWQLLKDPEQAKQTFSKLFKEYIKKGDIRHSNILQGMWDLLIAHLFMVLIRFIFMDDPEVTGVSYEQQLKQKSAISQNMYWVAKSASSDLDIVSSFKQLFFEWEAPSFNILQHSITKFCKSFGDDDLTLTQELVSGTVNTVGMFKPVRPVVNDWLDE